MSHILYEAQYIPSEEELIQTSHDFLELMEKRRSLRFFSERPVPDTVIQNLIMTASSAPSGANKQPWSFCAICSPSLKKQIRQAAEEEEYRSYHGRMNQEWLQDLAPLGTNWEKPFLETAPWLIIAFRRGYELDADGHKHQNYYVNESVGLACGFLLTAIHQAGLVALTHTPSPMDFLSKILSRPQNEKPYLLIPVGYPAPNATVPNIRRKPQEDVLVWYK